MSCHVMSCVLSTSSCAFIGIVGAWFFHLFWLNIWLLILENQWLPTLPNIKHGTFISPPPQPNIPSSETEVMKTLSNFFLLQFGDTLYIHSLKLTKTPLKIGRAPKGNNRIPGIHFQVQAVSFREDIYLYMYYKAGVGPVRRIGWTLGHIQPTRVFHLQALRFLAVLSCGSVAWGS